MPQGVTLGVEFHLYRDATIFGINPDVEKSVAANQESIQSLVIYKTWYNEVCDVFARMVKYRKHSKQNGWK